MIAATASNLLAFDVHSFGEELVRAGAVSDHDWRLAQEVGRQNAHTPLRSLLDLGLIGEEALAERLAAFAGFAPWSDEDETLIVSERLPLEFMRAAGVALLEAEEAEGGEAPALRLVVADPSDQHALRSTLAQLPAGVDVAVAPHKMITRFLAQTDERKGGAEQSGEERLDVSTEISQLRDMASEAPVIRFFNQVVERAMELGASDIHIERFDHRVSLRLRVDGLLIDQPPPPGRMYEPLICRVKIMAGLDIAERRKAQDGRIRMRLRGRMVDLRVSLVPTMYGQDVALRLQDRQKLGEITLPQLGFTDEQIAGLFRSASKSHGIMLVTGPTGSGKTTTLYALLRQLVSKERKVVTVEDPVEYAMDGVNQIQVNPAIGMGFGNTLRHILRHDPDVILIGEIRDRETAEIAFQAALTGHMVLSTLHTNDVPSTFVRLIDMGVEPYLVNAAIEGVSAQRLLRKLCADCGNDPERRESCKACGGIGYRGRVAVMEFSGMSGPLKRAIAEEADERTLADVLERTGYVPLRAHAQRLVEQGVTDEAEVLRALGHHAEDVVEVEA